MSVIRYVACIDWSIVAVIFVASLALTLVDAAFFQHTAIGRFARMVLEFPVLPWFTGRQAFFVGIIWKLVLVLWVYILHSKRVASGRR